MLVLILLFAAKRLIAIQESAGRRIKSWLQLMKICSMAGALSTEVIPHKYHDERKFPQHLAITIFPPPLLHLLILHSSMSPHQVPLPQLPLISRTAIANTTNNTPLTAPSICPIITGCHVVLLE